MVIIKAKNFTLRPIRMSDLKAYFESQQDRETRLGFLNPPKTLEQARKMLKEDILALRKKSGETLAIEVNGEYAGFVEIHDLNKKYFKHRATIGYHIAKKFRGRGITTSAVKLATAYAFKKYKLKRIEGWCRTFNKASARVLEKAGYKLEGILRKNKFKDGKYLDDMVFAKVK